MLDAAIGRCSGKLTGEAALWRGLHGRLKRDDIVLADRYYGSYFEFALLLARGVDLSPEMVRKELWGHLLISNLIRGVMAESARRHGVLPRQLSFQGARQMLEGFRVELNGASPEAIGGLIEVLLRMVSRLRVGDRPDRYEPRERKRRAKAYPLMHQPRGQSKKMMAKAG